MKYTEFKERFPRPITGARVQAFELRLRGWTYKRIGEELGISRQRAQQLTSAPPQIRTLVMNRAGACCEECGIDLAKSGHVHHKGCEAEGPNDYNDLPNLQYLCASCHRKAHCNYDR